MWSCPVYLPTRVFRMLTTTEGTNTYISGMIGKLQFCYHSLLCTFIISWKNIILCLTFSVRKILWIRHSSDSKHEWRGLSKFYSQESNRNFLLHCSLFTFYCFYTDKIQTDLSTYQLNVGFHTLKCHIFIWVFLRMYTCKKFKISIDS